MSPWLLAGWATPATLPRGAIALGWRTAADGQTPEVASRPGGHAETGMHERGLCVRRARPGSAKRPRSRWSAPTARSLVERRRRSSDGLLLRDPGLVQSGVDAAQPDQLRVVAALHDAAGVDDDDLVGGLCRREAVRDRDRGAAPGQ